LASSDRLFFFTAGKNGDHLEYYRHDSKQPLRYKVAVTEAVKAVIFYSYNFIIMAVNSRCDTTVLALGD